MPRAQSAFIKRQDVPDRTALQSAIDNLKFKLSLDEAYAPFKTSGYLPCTLEGEDAGFDLRFKDADLTSSADMASEIGDRDIEIALKWSGDVREMAAAVIFSAALAQHFGALVHDPDTEVFVSAEELIKRARKAVSSIG